MVWPSIPNPGNSNAMQKIDRTCELVSVFDHITSSIHSIARAKLNFKLPARLQRNHRNLLSRTGYTDKMYLLYWDVNAVEGLTSFYVTQELLESINTLKVEEWDTNSLQIVEKEAAIPDNASPFLHTSENEGDSAGMTCNWIRRDEDEESGGVPADVATGARSNVPQTDLHGPPPAFSSEYTTMEMLHQLMPQGVPADTDVTRAEDSESEETDLTVVKTGMDYIRQFSSSPTSDSELSTVLWKRPDWNWTVKHGESDTWRT